MSASQVESLASSPHIETMYKAIRPDQPHQTEILGQFPPEEQRVIGERQRILSAIGLYIGKDFRMPIELNTPGEGWHWDFGNNVIRIDPKDLIEKPMDYLRFVIAHEGGHRRISRTEGIPMEVWQQPGFAFMMNAIEDPRDNNFVAESYPRFREQMGLAYEMDLDFEGKAKGKAKEELGYQPRFIQAGLEYIKQWFKTTKGEDFAIDPALPDDIRAVVAATLQSAQDSWLHYPSRREADSGEELIGRYAKKSYEINRDEVWPEFRKLVEKDLEDQRLQEMLQEMAQGQSGEGEKSEHKGQGMPQGLQDSLTEAQQQELGEAIQKAIDQAQQEQEGKGEGEPQSAEGKSDKPGKMVAIDLDSLSPELKQKIQDYIDSLPEDTRRQLEEKARAALADFEQEVNEELEGKLSDNPAKKAERTDETGKETTEHKDESTGEEGVRRGVQAEETEELRRFRDMIEKAVNTDANAYEATRKEVLPLITALENDLRDIFVARRMNKWKSGQKSGKKIDIKRRMQEKAKGVSVVESKAWQRRELPQEKDYAISILVDLSGSMKEDDKIGETFKGVVVLSEVLNRLSIPTEILGFNDRLYEYQPFGQPMSQDVREKMGGMLQEVGDFSGTGKARWNDDGWALSVTSERLGRQKATEKFILVLSDGLPVESPRHPQEVYDLQKVVKQVTEGTDQKLIGLGIGRGTEHVENYYPNSVANINVHQMADRLTDVLRTVIENYDTF